MVITNILLGMLYGFLFGLIPLATVFLLGKQLGVGIFCMVLCSVCGGVFGYLEKSVVLTFIVAIIIVLFIATDKSNKSASVSHAIDDDVMTANEAISEDGESSTQSDSDNSPAQGDAEQ